MNEITLLLPLMVVLMVLISDQLVAVNLNLESGSDWCKTTLKMKLKNQANSNDCSQRLQHYCLKEL